MDLQLIFIADTYCTKYKINRTKITNPEKCDFIFYHYLFELSFDFSPKPNPTSAISDKTIFEKMSMNPLLPGQYMDMDMSMGFRMDRHGTKNGLAWNFRRTGMN